MTLNFVEIYQINLIKTMLFQLDHSKTPNYKTKCSDKEISIIYSYPYVTKRISLWEDSSLVKNLVSRTYQTIF